MRKCIYFVPLSLHIYILHTYMYLRYVQYMYILSCNVQNCSVHSSNTTALYSTNTKVIITETELFHYAGSNEI